MTGSALAGLSVRVPGTTWTLTARQARLPMLRGPSGGFRILPAAGIPKLALTGRI